MNLTKRSGVYSIKYLPLYHFFYHNWLDKSQFLLQIYWMMLGSSSYKQCSNIYTICCNTGPLKNPLIWTEFGGWYFTHSKLLGDLCVPSERYFFQLLPWIGSLLYLTSREWSPASVGWYRMVTVPSLLSSIFGWWTLPEGVCTTAEQKRENKRKVS